MAKIEEIIRNSDPRFIVWRDLCIDGGLTESLIREYNEFIWDRLDWLEIFIRLNLSEDFKREFTHKIGIDIYDDEY